jgi:hypothetical protein
MPLTRIQITHAQLRIKQAKNKYLQIKLAALGDAPKVDKYTDAEKLAFIRSGQATFNKTSDLYGHVTNAFTYPVLGKHVEQQAAYDAWDKARDDIRTEAQRIEDELVDQLIMSPDGNAALTRIAEAFAA